MIADEVRKEGFEIFKAGLVRRLSPTHFVSKTLTALGWQVVELKDGKWVCDCQANGQGCSHLYATQLTRSTLKLQPEATDEAQLKCRYCGSPDVARCGFRYNARGISRRYRCNDCQRKFSIPHVQHDGEAQPNEIVWLVNEIGLLIARLTDLLTELNSKIQVAGPEKAWCP